MSYFGPLFCYKVKTYVVLEQFLNSNNVTVQSNGDRGGTKRQACHWCVIRLLSDKQT